MDNLKDVLGFIVKFYSKNNEPYRSHLSIRDGKVVYYNGIELVGGNIGTDRTFFPNLEKFVRSSEFSDFSLDRLDVFANKVVMSNNNLVIDIPCISGDLLKGSWFEPCGGDSFDVDASVGDALSFVIGYSKYYSQLRPASGLFCIFSNYLMYTDHHIVITKKIPIDIDFKKPVVISKQSLKRISSRLDELVNVTTDYSRLLFKFSDGTWCCVNLIDEKYPIEGIMQLFNKTANLAYSNKLYPITKELRSAVDDLSLTKIKKLNIEKGNILVKDESNFSAKIINLPNSPLDGDFLFNLDYVKSILNSYTHYFFEPSDNMLHACMFEKDNYLSCALIMGMRK